MITSETETEATAEGEAPAAPSVAELNRRLAEKRRTAGVDPSGSTSRQFEARDVECVCLACGAEFVAPVLYIGDRLWMGGKVPEHCDGCRWAAEQRAAAAQEEARRRAEAARLAEREGEILAMIERAGANPWAHGAATLDNFDTSDVGTNALVAARELVEEVRTAGKYDRVRGLYLVGPTGTGKTHLAVGILRAVLADVALPPEAVVFDHAIALINQIQDTYSAQRSSLKLIERRANARLWIIDDLGTEKPSDDVVRRLTDIFTRREGKATVVTSNLTIEELTDRKRHPEFFRLDSRLGPRCFRALQLRGRDRRFG